MNSALLVIAIILAVLLLWLITQIAQSQKKSSALESQLTELRRDLLSVAQTQSQSAGQIQSIGTSVSQRLESVTKALHDGVTNSAQIATHGQTAIAAELKNTREQILQLQEQIGAVHEQSRGLSLATQSIENILGGTKTRGLLGEVTLQRLLEDSLPPSQFSLQYRFSSGEAADAVIFLRDKKLMAIDSKFPLDAFRRIESDGDEARRAFASAVKGHADAAYCRDKKIVAVSPNTLYANLCVIAMGMRGMQIEENARRILSSLDGMTKQMETFADVFQKLGNHLKNAQQSYAEADKRFEKAQDTLGGMLGQAPVQATLPLPEPK
jgi:DNA recombination protein RmuC